MQGTSLTPVWVGIHDGTFDTYDRSKTVTVAMERLAEDGNNDLLIRDFANSEGTVWDGTVGTEPIAPGRTLVETLEFPYVPGKPLYISYASMVLPSNDFFVSNGAPTAHMIVDEDGNFEGAEIIVWGSSVLDAGTEVNDELPENTAFFGQAEPDTGVNENGVVTLATGFKDASEDGILADPIFSNADFTVSGYQVMNVKIVPMEASRGLRGSD